MTQKLLCVITKAFSGKRFEELLCLNHQGESGKTIKVNTGVSAITLIRSNKVQQYAGIYLLQIIYSTCFGRPAHPSSGVHKTVTAASGTGHSI